MASESAATDKSIDADLEPVTSDVKTEDPKDTEVPSTSEDEHKPEETPELSTDLKISEDKNVADESEAKANPEPSIDSVVELTSSEDTKKEVQKPVPAGNLTTVIPEVFEATEKDVVEPNAPTSMEVTVKDLEVESGMPEEQKQELLNAVVPNISEAPEDVDLNTPTSIEVPVKDLEVESGLPEEQKEEKTIDSQEPISNETSIAGLNEVVGSSSYEEKTSGDAEAAEKKDDSIKVKDIEVESGMPEEQTQELLNAGVPNVSQVPEKVDDLSAVTSIEVPVKDLEVEYGSPEEQKQEKAIDSKEPISNATSITGLNEVVESPSFEEKASGDAEAAEKMDDSIKINAKDLEVEPGIPEKQTQELINAGVPSVSHAPEKNDDLNSPTSIEVPVKDLEVESGLLEEQKQENTTDSQGPISNVTSSTGLNEVVESSSYEGKTSGDVEAAEKKDDSINVTVKDLDAESGVPEEQTQELLHATVPNVSGGPENIDDLNAATSIEVPVKDLEFESGSPEEQKQEKTTDSQEPISNAASITGLNEVVESSSFEEKASGDADAVEKKYDGLEEEKPETLVETHKDLEDKTEEPQSPSSKEVANNREDVNVDGAFADLDGSPQIALVSPKGEKASQPVELVKAKDEPLEGGSINETPKMADAFLEGEKTLEGDEVIGKEKAENEKAVAEEKAVETAEFVNEEKHMGTDIEKGPLEATSKDFDIAPGATEVPSEGEHVSADNPEKNENLKDRNAASLEAPKGFTAAEESPEQVIEGKENENSMSEKGSTAKISRESDQAEPSTEIVKDIGALETVKDVKDETSKDLSLEEKDVKVPEDRKDEVKVEEAMQTTTDMLENEQLGTEKQESEKTKDQDPIVSSDAGDAKPIKEATKRESTNIFSKVKRSIVKAKKAILGKSPGPKNVSADAKNENS